MRPWGPRLCTLLLGCSSLGEGDTVVSLEVLTPQPAVMEQYDTLRLRARALNLQGDSVAAVITWVAADTLAVVTGGDSLSTVYTSGIGKVQARSGSLRSAVINFSIRRQSDTLVIVGSATDTVVTDDSASAPLVAAVLSLRPDTAGIGGTRIHYVIDSGPVDSVHFAGDVSELFAPTGSTGEPATPVTLRRREGTTGTVIVTVDAVRPSGKPVPVDSTSRRFTVVFE